MIKLQYFTEDEFNYPHEMSEDLLLMLDFIRGLAEVPIHITSDYRPGDSGSAHGKGLAVDIADNRAGRLLSSRWRDSVLDAIYTAGVSRKGVYDRHIHIDIDKSRAQNVCWWGESD